MASGRPRAALPARTAGLIRQAPRFTQKVTRGLTMV